MLFGCAVLGESLRPRDPPVVQNQFQQVGSVCGESVSPFLYVQSCSCSEQQLYRPTEREKAGSGSRSLCYRSLRGHISVWAFNRLLEHLEFFYICHSVEHLESFSFAQFGPSFRCQIDPIILWACCSRTWTYSSYWTWASLHTKSSALIWGWCGYSMFSFLLTSFFPWKVSALVPSVQKTVVFLVHSEDTWESRTSTFFSKYFSF